MGEQSGSGSTSSPKTVGGDMKKDSSSSSPEDRPLPRLVRRDAYPLHRLQTPPSTGGMPRLVRQKGVRPHMLAYPRGIPSAEVTPSGSRVRRRLLTSAQL